jgi:hypothetical protein
MIVLVMTEYRVLTDDKSLGQLENDLLDNPEKTTILISVVCSSKIEIIYLKKRNHFIELKGRFLNYFN